MIIEKGVPMPAPKTWHGGPKPKYPFRDMEIGDSVFFPNEPDGSASNPAACSRVHGHNHGKKFSSRKEGSGVRIWRTK